MNIKSYLTEIALQNSIISKPMQFPDCEMDPQNIKVVMINEIVPKKAVNMITKSRTKKNIIPSSVTKTPLITFTYAKDPDRWINATIIYVDVSGNPLPRGVGTGIDQEIKTQFAPLGAEHVLGQVLFTPPDAVDTTYKPVVYKLNSAPADTADYTACTFHNGFNAVFTADNQMIYIIYSTSMIDITETFWNITGENPVQITDKR